jgi:hypothetical protein
MKYPIEEYVPGEFRWFGHILDTQLKQIRLIYLSDAHYGNPLFSMKHFARSINFIRDNDDVYGVANGDLLEAVLRSSLGDVHTQKRTPQQQRDDMTDMLMPIKKKLLGMTTGNHEFRIYRETGIDVSQDIAKALGIPYRPEGILLKISFGHGNNRMADKPYVFWCYSTHGYGGARTKAAKAVKAERASTWVHSDLTAISHDHVVNVAPDTYLMPDDRGHEDDNGFITGKIVAHRKMLVKTNAYLKWGGYSEQGGFPPTDLTTPVIMLLTPESDYWKLVPDRPERSVKVIV